MHNELPYRIREINVRKDIGQIPDLIELCFHPYLDPDGAAFIDRMRSVAEDWKRLSFLSVFTQVDFSILGYVCENREGEIIGNVNLFPVNVKNRFAFLIANVCVHPQYRARGIGASMMREALHYAERQHASEVYLQVREETPEVLRMYMRLGFSEDSRRTGWLRPRKLVRDCVDPSIRREKLNWQERHLLTGAFKKWYPDDVIWNLNYDSKLFRYGWFFSAWRFLARSDTEAFRMTDPEGQTICWVGWQPTNNFSNNLWVVPVENCTEAQMRQILSVVGTRYARFKPLMVSFPKGVYADAFLESGFFVHNRLIWMHKPL